MAEIIFSGDPNNILNEMIAKLVFFVKEAQNDNDLFDAVQLFSRKFYQMGHNDGEKYSQSQKTSI